MKYAWAAYKKTGLDLADLPDELSAAEFGPAFEQAVLANYDAVWTLFAEAKGKVQPVGLALGFWPHEKARNMVLDRLVWFPWASARNRIECAVKFFAVVRREIPMLGFSLPKDKEFFAVIMRHGIVRRVGTSYNVFVNEPATVYETRWEH